MLAVLGGAHPNSLPIRAGSEGTFQALARIDGEAELKYLNNGGILQTVLRRLKDEA